jgi:hypothetical protein
LSFYTTSSSSSDLQQQKPQPITAVTPLQCLPQLKTPRHPPNQLALNKDLALFAPPTTRAQESLLATDTTQQCTLDRTSHQAAVGNELTTLRDTPINSASILPNSFSSQSSNTYQFSRSNDKTTKNISYQTDNMSFPMNNYTMQSNVAYQGTESDLNSSVFNSFLPAGTDMQLFGGVEDPQLSALRVQLSGFLNHPAPVTVSPEQLHIVSPQTESQALPSSTNIPELDFEFTPEELSRGMEYTPLTEDGALFSGYNSLDVSPLIGDNMPADGVQYPPLFPEANLEGSMPPAPIPQPSVLGAVSSKVRKPKRAAKVLPPINPDEIEDPTAKKRAKNTEAARRSRAKKLSNEQQLEATVASLLAEKQQLQERLAASEQRNQQLMAALGQSPPLPNMGLINDFSFTS